MSETDSFNRFQFTQSAHFEVRHKLLARAHSTNLSPQFRRPGTPESQTSTIHRHHDRSGSDHSDATAVPSTPQSATFLIPHSKYIASVCDESLSPKVAAQRHSRSETR